MTSADYGGMESVSIQLLKAYNRDKYQICPIVLIKPDVYENIFIQKLRETEIQYFTVNLASKVHNRWEHILSISPIIKLVYKTIQENNFNLIHSNGTLADFISIPISKLKGIPIISTCHGYIMNKDKKLWMSNRIDMFMLKYCDRIIAVSQEIMDDLARSGIDKSKIVVIQNAIEIPKGLNNLGRREEKRQKLSLGREELIIGYVGRLSEEKGIGYLIEAASILKKRTVSFKLIILGDGPKMNELKLMTKSKGLEKEIYFTGYQRNIEEWLPILDIFVLPSLMEGTPMALLEAMSLGIPVIASSVGNIPRIIDSGINGILVNPGDCKGLSKSIEMLRNDPKLRKKMATEAVNTIEKRYDVNEWYKKIERQYDILLQNKL